MNKKVRLNKPTAFDWFNAIFLGALAIIMAFPLYYTIIVSFAKYEAIVESQLYVLPVSFTLEAYTYIFKGADFILSSFFVSVFITIIGTVVSLVLSTMLAYPLSKRELPFGKIVMIFIIFTMLFDAGLIPYYLTIKSVKLVDSILVMILPMAISAFNVILLRNYFESLPSSLEESARIDGANDITILIRIILPLSMPILATVALFYAVDRWNEWWHPLLFISTKSKRPLQLVLREILTNFQQTLSSGMGQSIKASNRPVYGRSLQMAIVVVAAVPIMSLYPYLQKHFTKGIMLGAVKG